MSEMTAEQLDEAQRTAYGKYVAAGPIDIDRVRAFNEGDPVPIGHVEGHEEAIVEDDGDGNRVDTGRTRRVEPVVRLDQVKKVTAKKAVAKAAATKES